MRIVGLTILLKIYLAKPTWGHVMVIKGEHAGSPLQNITSVGANPSVRLNDRLMRLFPWHTTLRQ